MAKLFKIFKYENTCIYIYMFKRLSRAIVNSYALGVITETPVYDRRVLGSSVRESIKDIIKYD